MTLPSVYFVNLKVVGAMAATHDCQYGEPCKSTYKKGRDARHLA